MKKSTIAALIELTDEIGNLAKEASYPQLYIASQKVAQTLNQEPPDLADLVKEPGEQNLKLLVLSASELKTLRDVMKSCSVTIGYEARRDFSTVLGRILKLTES